MGSNVTRPSEYSDEIPTEVLEEAILRTGIRGLFATAITAVATLAQPAVAAAHTDDDADLKHMAIEFGLWGAGLGAVIALLVAVFWVRAMLLRRGE